MPLPLRPHWVQWYRLGEVLDGALVVGHERVLMGSFAAHLDGFQPHTAVTPGQVTTEQRAILRGEIANVAPLRSGDWIQHGDQQWMVVSEPVVHDAEPILAHATVELQTA